MSRAIVCFTRIPVPGCTKTRLMPLFSGEECAQIHMAMLRDIAGICRQQGVAVYVAYDPVGDVECLKKIFPFAKDFLPQQGEGLGQRMCHAFAQVFAQGHTSCLLIGSDVPLLRFQHFETAWSALERAEVTLGATMDGGYYLVGMNTLCPVLFENKQYGNGSVYQQAVDCLAENNISFAPALPSVDLDTPEDLENLRKKQEQLGPNLRKLFWKWYQ